MRLMTYLQTNNKQTNTNREWLLASSCITPFGRTATREMITACWYHHSPLAKRQLGIMMVENGSATHIQPLAERQLGMKLVYANQLGNSHGTTTNISKNDQICLYIYIKRIYTQKVKHCHQQNGTWKVTYTQMSACQTAVTSCAKSRISSQSKSWSCL